jgi:hypothetical protein
MSNQYNLKLDNKKEINITADENIGINQSLLTNDDVIFNNLTISNLQVNKDVNIDGNLTVVGTSTKFETTVSSFSDRILELGSTSDGDVTIDGGFIIKRGNEKNIYTIWDEGINSFVIGKTDLDGSSSDLLTDNLSNRSLEFIRIGDNTVQFNNGSPQLPGISFISSFDGTIGTGFYYDNGIGFSKDGNSYLFFNQSNFFPNNDNQFDLGNETNKFKNIYSYLFSADKIGISSGSANEPALFFKNNEDLGIYFDTNSINFSINSKKNMELLSSQLILGDKDNDFNIISDGNKNLILKTSSTNSSLININGNENGNINILSPVINFGKINQDVNLTTNGFSNLLLSTNNNSNTSYFVINNFDENNNIDIYTHNDGNLNFNTNNIKLGKGSPVKITLFSYDDFIPPEINFVNNYIEIKGDILPTTDNVYSLGNEDNRFKNIFLSNDNIQFNQTKLFVKNDEELYFKNSKDLEFKLSNTNNFEFNIISPWNITYDDNYIYTFYDINFNDDIIISNQGFIDTKKLYSNQININGTLNINDIFNFNQNEFNINNNTIIYPNGFINTDKIQLNILKTDDHIKLYSGKDYGKLFTKDDGQIYYTDLNEIEFKLSKLEENIMLETTYWELTQDDEYLETYYNINVNDTFNINADTGDVEIAGSLIIGSKLNVPSISIGQTKITGDLNINDNFIVNADTGTINLNNYHNTSIYQKDDGELYFKNSKDVESKITNFYTENFTPLNFFSLSNNQEYVETYYPVHTPFINLDGYKLKIINGQLNFINLNNESIPIINSFLFYTENGNLMVKFENGNTERITNQQTDEILPLDFWNISNNQEYLETNYDLVIKDNKIEIKNDKLYFNNKLIILEDENIEKEEITNLTFWNLSNNQEYLETNYDLVIKDNKIEIKDDNKLYYNEENVISEIEGEIKPEYFYLSNSKESIETDYKLYLNKLIEESGTSTNLVIEENQVKLAASDIRLKKDIKKIENSKEIINKLNPVEFKWKKTGNKSYGLIAQEVEKIIPEAVSNNDYKSYDLRPIVAYLIKLNQELIKEIDDLKSHFN